MKVERNESINEILISECENKLDFKYIARVAKKEGLKDYAIEEDQLSGDTGYTYKLKY